MQILHRLPKHPSFSARSAIVKKKMQTTAPPEREIPVVSDINYFCLICETNVDSSTSANIFYSTLPRNGESLASFVPRVLHPFSVDLRSSYMCPRCHGLFKILEQAQWTVSNVISEILKLYHSGESNENEEIDLSEGRSLFKGGIIARQAANKSIVNNDGFADIEGFETLRDERNEFDGSNIEINNFIETRVNEKRDIEVSFAIPEILEYKSQEVESRLALKTCVPEERNKQIVGIASNEPTNVRETTSRMPNELRKNLNGESRVNPEETIGDNAITQTLDSAYEKQSLYTLRCTLCSRLFKSAEDLQNHSIKHGRRPYRCDECGERFAEFLEANNHSSNIHSSTKNCISLSNEPLNNETVDFSKDDWIFSNEFRRTESDESTTSVDAVEDQKSNERTERPWKSGRIAKYSLKALKYACSTCGKKWKTSAELKTHVKSHSNLRPYMCEKCGQAYKHKHALEIHVGMHNGTSPFRCNVCDKCFTQKGALMRHLPMHTGETPYQCELCGKRFVHHTSYNMHALSHTGKKSYRCHVCDLSLLSTSHLKRHMRVHTGEKPYDCTLCGKSFAERYNLFAHRKIHDPVEIMAKAAKKMTYKCERCGEYFDKKQKLEDHTKECRHCASRNSSTNGRKWIGHTVEVEMPVRNNDGLAERSWPDLDYGKLHTVGFKTPRNDHQLTHFSHDSVTMLVSQTNYNNGMVIQPTETMAHTKIQQTLL